jgi:hypothetical protein
MGRELYCLGLRPALGAYPDAGGRCLEWGYLYYIHGALVNCSIGGASAEAFPRHCLKRLPRQDSYFRLKASDMRRYTWRS